MTRSRRLYRTPLVLVASLVLASSLLQVSCAGRKQAPQTVAGVTFGTTRAQFRGRWWQYYDRGVSWGLGGFWNEAEADLRACLRLRQTDARRARTYGMHFVQCFAHRELGAVLIERGQLDEAEREVLASLAQEPSAKAEFLLERIRALRAGAPPPTVDAGSGAHIALDTITAHAAQPGSLNVAGSVGAGAALEAVAADGSARALVVETAGHFTALLNAGERLRTGRGTTAVVVVPIPPAAPALTVDGPGDGRIVTEAQVLYRYEASAEAGLTEMSVTTVDGTVLARQALHGLHGAGMLAVPLEPGEHVLHFTVTDRSGRSVTDQRHLSAQPRPEQDRALRATALVLPLQAPIDGAGLQSGDDPLFLTMLNRDGRFRLLDRQADELLNKELRLIEAGYVDSATAAEAGRRLKTRYAVTATLRRGRADIECFIRLIHVESGEEVARADAYAPIADATQEQSFFAAVANRLRQAFPVLAGELRVPAEGRMELGLGRRQGVINRMRFHVLSVGKDLVDAKTGTVLAPGKRTVQATIEADRVYDDLSEMRAVAGIPRADKNRVVSE